MDSVLIAAYKPTVRDVSMTLTTESAWAGPN